MVRLGRGEFMVAVVDGRRRWRLVYVRYRLYYSYVNLRRIYLFWLVDGGSRSRTKEIVGLTGIPLKCLSTIMSINNQLLRSRLGNVEPGVRVYEEVGAVQLV